MKKFWKKMLSVFMTAILTVSAFGGAAAAESGKAIYASPEGTGDGTSAENAASFADALEIAATGDIVYLAEGEYHIDAVPLTKGITLQGSSKENSVIIVNEELNRLNTGERHGFQFYGATDGVVTFRNLTIQAAEDTTSGVLAPIHILNRDAQPANVVIDNCTISNTGTKATYRHAIALEYTSGEKRNYFNLTVKDSTITAASYGIGSGLDNGNPDMSQSTLQVSNTCFEGSGTQNASIYNIHLPVSLKEIDVDGSEFYGTGSGGIKYIYSTSNTVRITNNIFDKSSADSQFPNSGAYAIMATTQTADVNDPRAYSYATELSGNTLKGQNTIIAVKAPVEVVWFPDGQAVNGVEYNNYGDSNTTDAGTRYGKSNYGGHKGFIVLTDFAIQEDSLNFVLADSTDAQNTIYYYNTQNDSGAYTNNNFETYWTDENPRHCSASLATFDEANAVTRWTFGQSDVASVIKAEEGETTLISEDEVAKVEIDTLTGNIKVTPKSAGTTYLTAYVGGVEFDAEGSPVLPNYKKDVLTITVSDTEEIPDPPTPSGAPSEISPSTPENSDPGSEEIPDESTPLAPPTGEAPINPAWMIAAILLAGGCAAAVVLCRRRESGKNH